MELAPAVVTLWRRQGLLLVAVVFLAAAGATAAAGLSDGPTVAVGASGLAVTSIVGGFVWWFPTRRYLRWSYQLDEVALEIRHGALIQRHSVIPYFRVQHVDTSRTTERGLSLAQLKIHTASSGTDATIPGLDESTAAELRARDRLAGRTE